MARTLSASRSSYKGHGAEVALALRALVIEEVIEESTPPHELSACRRP
jgi:hypothetical protein